MEVTIDNLIELSKMLNVAAPIIVGIVVFIICITNIDKLFLFLSAVQRFFSFCSRKARKGAISNNIRGRVMKSSKMFRTLGENVMASDLKIDWVKEENAESFIKNNQVIIRMEQNANPHKNFVTAVTAFVGQGLLPKAKRYIDHSIYDMSKMTVSRSLILYGDSDALDYFDESILSPTLNGDTDLKNTFDRLRTIDKNGMFVNILLNEYAKAAQKIYPDMPDPLFSIESSELLTYLYRIAMGSVGDLNEFQFNREYFKIHIFLTARTQTYQRSGIKPYLRHIGNSIAEGTETVYIFGLGKKISIAKEIVKSLQENDLRVNKIVEHSYRHRSNRDGRTVRGVCYEVEIYKE